MPCTIVGVRLPPPPPLPCIDEHLLPAPVPSNRQSVGLLRSLFTLPDDRSLARLARPSLTEILFALVCSWNYSNASRTVACRLVINDVPPTKFLLVDRKAPAFLSQGVIAINLISLKWLQLSQHPAEFFLIHNVF